jgi:hypothetical protein
MEFMRNKPVWIVVALTCWGTVAATCAAEVEPVYRNDFEKASAGNVPDEMMVLDGSFGVTTGADGNKYLELPGSPLETYGVLFGPAEVAGLSVQARIQGTGKGRRFPVFGVGLNGVGGYRLHVSPAKKALELFRGDEPITTAPFNWESGSWTVLRLEQVKVKEGEYAVRGKAWKLGEKEPADWAIKHTAKAEIPPGRPSIWGSPYAGTPIQFDDLRVTPVK